VHYGADYWADDSHGLPLMIQAVERYISKVDLAHPIWYHLRLAPLLWCYLYGPSVPFPTRPSPTGTSADPFPLVPLLPKPLRSRSVKSLLAYMRTEDCLPLDEELPSESSVMNFCRKRGIPRHTLSPVDPTSLQLSDAVGSSRRAITLATDIAGAPTFPDDAEGVPSERTPPLTTSVIDMSAYDLTVLPALSAPENYSEILAPSTCLLATSQTSIPASMPRSATQPDCKYFSIFDKRVNNS
jgi:hypothetical protein